jgi:hypothetical protein
MFNKKKTKAAVEPVPEDELGLLEHIAARGGDINFGAPTKCPACGDFGFVEVVAAGIQRNKCMNCGEVWQFSRRGLDLFNFANKVRAEEPRAVGRGVLIDTNSVGHLSRMTRETFVSMKDAIRHTFTSGDR